MSLSTLDDLIVALKQPGAVSAEALTECSVWCWDACDNTGDGRFASVARTLEIITRAWDNTGAFTQAAFEEITSLLSNLLPSVLEAPSPAEGASIARLMREEILGILADPNSFPHKPRET